MLRSHGNSLSWLNQQTGIEVGLHDTRSTIAWVRPTPATRDSKSQKNLNVQLPCLFDALNVAIGNQATASAQCTTTCRAMQVVSSNVPSSSRCENCHLFQRQPEIDLVLTSMTFVDCCASSTCGSLRVLTVGRYRHRLYRCGYEIRICRWRHVCVLSMTC